MTDEIRLLHEKIDNDFRFALECLQEVLIELGEVEIARIIPWKTDFIAQIEQLPAERACQLYSIVFQLLGMVEENAAVQVRRTMETANGPSHERGLWGNTLRKLKEKGFCEGSITAAFSKVHVEPVLTAHPTEAKRATVIVKHRALYLLMVKRENPIHTPAEQLQIRQEIKELLELLWRTGNTYLEKPEVTSELKNIIYYLTAVFPEAMTILDRRLKYAWSNEGYSTKTIQNVKLPKLTFGTWVGGDRDGHSLVTAVTTRESLQELRLNALLLIRKRLVELAAKLSLSDKIQHVPESLTNWIKARTLRLGNMGVEALARNHGESWRQALNLIIATLPLAVVQNQVAKLDDFSGCYQRPDELLDDISILEASISETGGAQLAATALYSFKRLVDSTGFQLAALDIRQNSQFHDRAICQLLVSAGMEETNYTDWSEEKRMEFINRELKSPRPFLLPGLSAGHEADAVLDCYRVIAAHIRSYGADGIGSLIVSMTRSCSDLLTVYLLAREAGLLVYDKKGCRSLLPVVPLFETIDDLQKAPQILQPFLAHPVTGNTLGSAVNKPIQQVMIGYSDSCKDGGILASHGALYKAQMELTTVADSCGTDICFFHGRGGSIGRGAGPTFRFLESLPHNSLRGSFRMTEQGETISQKYSNLLTATYNLELQLAGVLGMTVSAENQPLSAPEMPVILEFMADVSRKKYEELISGDGFMEFFSQATPIDVMENLKIGSRPSRRTGSRTLSDLRAIPWVFSWNQSRYMLPSWYGAGTALTQLNKFHPGLFKLLCDDITRFPLLRYLFMNIELAISQADKEIMHCYAGLVANRQISEHYLALIDNEYELTVNTLRMLFKTSTSERRPTQLKAIALRKGTLAALHNHQIFLLAQWRKELKKAGESSAANKLLEELFLTVHAIAGGIRTTG